MCGPWHGIFTFPLICSSRETLCFNDMSLTPSAMLPLGTSAPDFRLPDTNGKIVSLADFKSAPALLVLFICNHCPYVKHIRAALSDVGREGQRRGAAIVAISSNDVQNHPDDNPEKMKLE